MLEQALPILREIGQQLDESVVLGHLADVMESLGRYQEAYDYKKEARTLARESDDPQSEAEYLTGLSRIETFREDYESAQTFAREATTISQQHNYEVEQAGAWQAFGFSKIAAKKFGEAEDAYCKSLDLNEKLNQSHKAMELHAELAWLAHQRGDDPAAQKHVNAVLPNREAATLNSIEQPAVCWCLYEVLKENDPETANLLLHNGKSTLRQVAEKIADPKARQHYLKKLPHHDALSEARVH